MNKKRNRYDGEFKLNRVKLGYGVVFLNSVADTAVLKKKFRPVVC